MQSARRLHGVDDRSPTGRGIRVAVIDTGIDDSHPDLSGAIDRGSSRSFAVTTDSVVDECGHGTHVAGIIAGRGCCSNGSLRGIAPEATLVAIRLARTPKFHESTVAKAVLHAVEVKTDVINLSLGLVPAVFPPPWIWSTARSILEDALLYALGRGVVCVVAAGNSGDHANSVTRPGGLAEVLTVGAIDHESTPLQMSGRGPFLRSKDLPHPGVQRFDEALHSVDERILKPDLFALGRVNATRSPAAFASGTLGDDGTEDPTYVVMDGTSQATAIISGMAALALQVTREFPVDVGADIPTGIHRILCKGALPLRSSGADGSVIFWPSVLANLKECAIGGQSRDAILSNSRPRVV